MSHEHKLIAGLSITVLVILGLVSALTLSLNWSLLGVATLLFVLSYPLLWLALRCYRFWCQSIMQLTTYSQILQEGSKNLHFKPQNPQNLLLALQQQITQLAESNHRQNSQNHTVSHLLSHIIDNWPVPMCVFDPELKLGFRNPAMFDHIKQPMLSGSSAQSLGFEFDNGCFSHPQFDQQWQCQTIQYQHHGHNHWLFSALDISQPLHRHQSVTQQNLVRVLGHEIRNSLTPMASMTDTLLSAQTLNEQQTRLVLKRINQRSSRLLDFIEHYAQLSQLPLPRPKWFSLSSLIEEARSVVSDDSKITLQGEDQCWGDPVQLSQLFINLVKNAIEAKPQGQTKITIRLYHQQHTQLIKISDNGPGFANLDNALVPFYTTKKSGSGIGLTLCAEIAQFHGGQLTVGNNPDTGANIILRWPSNQLPFGRKQTKIIK